ncbi:MAG: hypothetical protein ACOYYS_02655 [Chloroflexota bacterium]
MKKKLSLFRTFTFLACFAFFSSAEAADASFSPPLQIDMQVDQTTLHVGDSLRATLSVNNVTPYDIVDINIYLNNPSYDIAWTDFNPGSIGPYESFQAEYVLNVHKTGLQRPVFTINYSWVDQTTTYRRVETATFDDIEVIGYFGIDWPEYLMPLLVGFLMSQLSMWVSERRKKTTDDKLQEEQVKGIILATLQSTRKGLEEMELLSYSSVWENTIVVGNLYPALHRVGRSSGYADLSRRLAELSILIIDYNEKRKNDKLTEDFVLDLSKEIDDLITIIS